MKEEKKKKINRKVIITLAVFLFAFTTLVTSSFAWFTIAQSATVGDLEMTVSNGGNLEISLDGVNYYDNLTKDQFDTYINNGMALTNVTTSDLENFYNSYVGDEAIANKDYLTFTLYFRCDDQEMAGLYLTNNITRTYNYNVAKNNKLKGTYVYSKGVEYTSPVTFQYSETEQRVKGSSATYYGAEALRLGFKELNFDDEDTRTELASFIYDPTENEVRGFGKEYGSTDFIRQYVDSFITVPTNNLPDTTYELTTTEYNYYAKNNNSLCGTFQARTDTSGKTYYYSKIQVSIWLEGWDADCFDAIYKDDIIMQLYFRTAIKAA
jgi:hypothetical protein